jgi:hypothetical protein
LAVKNGRFWRILAALFMINNFKILLEIYAKSMLKAENVFGRSASAISSEEKFVAAEGFLLYFSKVTYIFQNKN